MSGRFKTVKGKGGTKEVLKKKGDE